MIHNRQFTNKESGVRLDAAILLNFPASTRAFVREAIGEGGVSVRSPGNSGDGRTVLTKGYKLKGGETVIVKRLAEAGDNTVKPCADDPRLPADALTPVYEDEHLIAFDKPAGIPVQPLTRDETGTLMNAVAAKYPECIPLGDRPLMAGALHRIDAGTSGLVLVARSAASFDFLRSQFTAQTVEKTYLALVEGDVRSPGTLEHDLIHDPTLPFCKMIDARRDRHSPIAAALKKPSAPSCASSLAKTKPLHAVTAYKPMAHTVEENEERTLLEVKIFTGVTHQIRAQLALGGMHIINDRLYGAFAVENQTGHFLHAFAAKFIHPQTKRTIEISTRPPVWARRFSEPAVR